MSSHDEAVVRATILKFEAGITDRCFARLKPLGVRFLAADKVALKVAIQAAIAEDPLTVSSWLDTFDRRWARVETAMANLRRTCG
jgi:hypothetical protein